MFWLLNTLTLTEIDKLLSWSKTTQNVGQNKERDYPARSCVDINFLLYPRADTHPHSYKHTLRKAQLYIFLNYKLFCLSIFTVTLNRSSGHSKNFIIKKIAYRPRASGWTKLERLRVLNNCYKIFDHKLVQNHLNFLYTFLLSLKSHLFQSFKTWRQCNKNPFLS